MLHGPIPTGKSLHDVCPWHETSGETEYVHMPKDKKVWKSHLCWNDTYLTEKKVKYIYVARNGKDVAVSLYHHAKGFLLFE